MKLRNEKDDLSKSGEARRTVDSISQKNSKIYVDSVLSIKNVRIISKTR